MKIVFIAGLFLFITTTCIAQNKGSLQNDTAAMSFIREAGVGGKKEVAAGQLARSMAANAKVKTFGSQMVKDHTKANTELENLSAKKGYKAPPPSELDTQPDKMLADKKGISFDKAYITMMLDDHKKTIALFERGQKNVKDAGLKAFITKTLPTLRMHQKMARDLAASLDITRAQ